MINSSTEKTAERLQQNSPKDSEDCTKSIVNRLNPFPHNDTFRRPWETSLLKTLWEKEKLLVTSNFSFAHSVFYPFG